MDAVNGSQLFATNNNVSDLSDRVDTAESNITNIQGDITEIDNRVTVNEGNIANLTTQINSGGLGLVKQSAAGANLTVGAATDGVAVDFTGTAGERKLTGVAAGDLSAVSVDAVNGSQLFATNNKCVRPERSRGYGGRQHPPTFKATSPTSTPASVASTPA